METQTDVTALTDTTLTDTELVDTEAISEDPSASEVPFREGVFSFVRRGDRMTEGQAWAWTHLADTMRIEVNRSINNTSVADGSTREPVELFGREAPLVVEVGSGQGHAIVYAAERNPETNFLAVEVFRGGLARTMGAAHRAEVENVRVVEANAPEVLERLLPAASVDELWLFFPDPWPKAKHNKRRLVAPEFAELVARALKSGGVLRMATDWEDYALQMRRVLDASDSFERDFTGDWAERFDGRVLTVFERKGTDAGRDIRDLSYRRSA